MNGKKKITPEAVARRTVERRREQAERDERARREYEALCAARRRRRVPAEGVAARVGASRQ